MQYYIIQFNICTKQYIVYEYDSLDLYTVFYLYVCFWLKFSTGVTPVLLRLVSADISDIFEI